MNSEVNIILPKHFILRIGDGVNFKNSSTKCIWGIKSNTNCGKSFLKKVKEGDILWFVKTKSRGLIVAVATFAYIKERELGTLINLTDTNKELGWTCKQENDDWDVEIHYKDLYNLTYCNLLSEIKSPLVIRLYCSKCKINLPEEYQYIVRYSRILNKM